MLRPINATSTCLSALSPSFASSQSTVVLLFTALLILASALGLRYVLGAPRGFDPPRTSKARRLSAPFPGLGQTSFYGKTRPAWIARHLPDHTKGDVHDFSPLRINLSNRVVTVLHGLPNAKTFFTNRDLNFRAGFGALSLGVATARETPRTVGDLQEAPTHGKPSVDAQWSRRHVRECISNKRLTDHDVMAKVASDIMDCLQDTWCKLDNTAAEGSISLTEDLYTIMMRVSMRVVGCTEIADDKARLKPIMQSYWTIERANGAVNILYPLLPVPSNVRRIWNLISLHKRIKAPIVQRIKSGQRQEDYVQTLIDAGCPTRTIMLWVSGFLFASIINTSSVLAWTLSMASADRTIWAKLRSEIDETMARLNAENGTASDASTKERFAALSIEQLEDNFEYTYHCVRECMRLLIGEMLYRRVDPRTIGGTSSVAGEELRDGEYVGMLAASINQSADIYRDPLRYDPERWSPQRNEGSGPYEFVGWGAGVHPCIGMKLAKSELKMAIAMVVSLMDIVPVNDADGMRQYTPDDLPRPQIFHGRYRAPTGPLLLHYTARAAVS